MKKFFSIALAAVMTLSMGALAVAAAEDAPADSMNVSYYKLRDPVAYVSEDTIIESGYFAHCGYNGTVSRDGTDYNVDVKQFDATIDKLIDGSFLMETKENETGISVLNDRGDYYVYKWTGTMTAKETGSYTLIGRMIDNGFVMKVNGEKVFEYWGASHWFDGGSDRLVSDEGAFDVVAGDEYEVEIYYLELGGGDRLQVYATTTPDDKESGTNIDEAFTFDLTQTTYSGDRAGWLNNFIGAGNSGNGGNGGKIEESNQKFDVAILDELDEWTDESLPTTVSKFNENLPDQDAYVIQYTGSLTPDETGTYIFGAAKIDNGFYLEINGKPVYEFWAGSTWNDDGSGNIDSTGIELEAGKAYNFTAYFLETNGGQGLEIRHAVNADEDVTIADMTAIEDGFVFSTEPTADTPVTNEPSTNEPSTNEPATNEPSTNEPSTTTTQAPSVTTGPSDSGTNDSSAEEDGSVLPIVIGVVAAVVVIAVVAVVIVKKKK